MICLLRRAIHARSAIIRLHSGLARTCIIICALVTLLHFCCARLLRNPRCNPRPNDESRCPHGLPMDDAELHAMVSVLLVEDRP